MVEENEIGGIDQAVDLDETQGYSLVYIAKNGKFMGWIGMTDEIRPEASGALEELGWRAFVAWQLSPVTARR